MDRERERDSIGMSTSRAVCLVGGFRIAVFIYGKEDELPDARILRKGMEITEPRHY